MALRSSLSDEPRSVQDLIHCMPERNGRMSARLHRGLGMLLALLAIGFRASLMIWPSRPWVCRSPRPRFLTKLLNNIAFPIHHKPCNLLERTLVRSHGRIILTERPI